MKENAPFLSICIPTRNRAAFLYRTLRSITETSVFRNGNEIEIVVSDNASTDATEEIVKIFTEKYGDKIVYSRNETDIADKNFEKALRLGHGEFLKLNNDTFWFRDNKLEELLSDIKQYQKDRPVLFFPNDKSGKVVLCSDLSEFVEQASYSMTWIGAFGIWKDDLERITDFSANANTQLTQTDILLREVARKKNSVVFKKKYIEYQFFWNKRKYDVSKIFGQYYLDFLKLYVDKNILSGKVFRKEKRRLLNHIFNYFYSSNMVGKDVKLFDSLKKYYAFSIFFYLRLIVFLFNHLIKDLICWWKIKKRGADGNFKKQWKKRNGSSFVVPVQVEYPNAVYVGNGSSGELFVENCNPETNTLIIGENVKIGKDVRFVFNDAGKWIMVGDDTVIPDGTVVYSHTEGK